MGEELLRLEKLSVDYKVKGGYLSAVRNVDILINQGEILAIVGESGCGKSTIAHSIMRLLISGNERITGNIYFKGEDLNKLSDRNMEKMRGKHLGMIFQNPMDSLNPVYKTGHQVAEAIMLDGISREKAWQQVVALYQDVKMPDAQKRATVIPMRCPEECDKG